MFPLNHKSLWRSSRNVPDILPAGLCPAAPRNNVITSNCVLCSPPDYQYTKRMWRKWTVPASVFISLVLSGCIDKEGRVRSHLVDMGFSEPAARCMAQPMSSQLSVAQLQRLGSLSKAMRRADQPHGVERILDRLAQVGDPEIIAVVGQATLGCMFR